VRILFAAQLLPFPLDAGPKVRAYYVLRHLAEAGHDVTLLCFVRPGDRPRDLEEMSRYCRGVEPVPISRSRLRDLRDGILTLVSETPFLIRRDRRPAMNARLAQLTAARTFDAFHADQLWMAPLGDLCDGVGLKVLDQHNAVFKVPERLATHHPNAAVRALLKVEASKLARFERVTIDRFDDVVWVSREDREAVCGTDTGGRQHVIPIAVDPRASAPVPRPRPFRVTFLGGLHWPPNADGVRWFATSVWPAVSRAVPAATFTVIGKGAGRVLHSDPSARIDVRGYVEDLRSALAETAAFVVPLRTGAGMRVKILDAWCWGLPVVSTSVGAEGIDIAPGENVLVADEPAAFADEVIRLLKDPALSCRIAAGGRSTVEARYDWRKVYEAWGQVYH
jgi:glycosyltransferase involved in cell wall biosynthesis